MAYLITHKFSIINNLKWWRKNFIKTNDQKFFFIFFDFFCCCFAVQLIYRVMFHWFKTIQWRNGNKKLVKNEIRIRKFKWKKNFRFSSLRFIFCFICCSLNDDTVNNVPLDSVNKINHNRKKRSHWGVLQLQKQKRKTYTRCICIIAHMIRINNSYW